MLIHAKRVSACLVAVAISLIGTSCGTQTPEAGKKEDVKTAALAKSAACNFPTTMASSNEQTAWQIFVAANCANNGKLTWETWK